MMPPPAPVSPQIDLGSAIVYPLTIAPTAQVREAITLLSAEISHTHAQRSCLLVLEGDCLVGILTTGDLLRLSASGQNLAEVTIAMVMASPVLTFNIHAFTDPLIPFRFFEEHHIGHLPLVDDQGRVVGMVTQTSLLHLLSRITLQQTTAYQRIQTEWLERQKIEAALKASEERYRQIVETTLEGIWIINAQGYTSFVNACMAKMLGYQKDEMIGKSLFNFMDEEGIKTATANIERRKQGIEEQHDFRFKTKTGADLWTLISTTPLYDDEGNYSGSLATITDISARKTTETLLELQNTTLERIAKAEPLPKILDMLLRAMELQLVDALCSIMLCDGKGKLRCLPAPQIPESYLRAVDGIPIQEGAGSCGTAAFRQEPVIVTDIATDPLWDNYRARALTYGLRACWAVPIIASDSRILGTFVFYYRYSRAPQAQELKSVTQAANIAGIAIERDLATQELKQLNQKLEQRVKKRTAALQASEERWQLALQGANDGIWDWDVRHGTIFYSERWKSIRGFGENELSNSAQEWSSRIHPDDVDRVNTAIDDHFAGRTEFFEIEYRTQRKDGSYMWVLDRSKALRDPLGQVVRMVGSESDITQRKQVEKSLQESQQFIQTVVDTVPIPLFWKNQESVYLGCNQEFSKILNFSSTNEVIGKNDFDLSWTEEESIAYRIDDRTVMKSGEAKLRIEEMLTLPNGEQIWLETHKAPMRDWANNVIGVVGMFQNITTRKKAEVHLQKTNEELLCATRMKDEFLANMSHELRTPLNVILGLSESLLEEVFGTLNNQQKTTVSTIEQSGQHLLSLINDILDLSKIEASKLELNLTNACIAELCKSSVVFVKQQAFSKKIKLNVILPNDLEKTALDERRMRQVLINLLNNAVKFTPNHGQITLEVQVRICEDRPWIYFSVSDTGIGITATDQIRLFQPFIQLDSKLNRQYEGTGLGLALVKRIVELHGGEVNLQSVLGMGSCFTVRLPLVTQPEDPTLTLDPYSSTTIAFVSKNDEKIALPLILLAEDNEASISTLSNYLEAKGYRILVARNGQEAIDLAQMHRPDLILMDIQMSGIDGLEAMRRIRLDPNLISIAIIALTALAMPQDRQKCLDAGANEYLTKPVRLKELVTSIQLLTAKTRKIP